jgi:hypothetical protein
MEALAYYGSARLQTNNGLPALNSSNFTQEIINKSEDIKKNHLDNFVVIPITPTHKKVFKKVEKKPKGKTA